MKTTQARNRICGGGGMSTEYRVLKGSFNGEDCYYPQYLHRGSFQNFDVMSWRFSTKEGAIKFLENFFASQLKHAESYLNQAKASVDFWKNQIRSIS